MRFKKIDYFGYTQETHRRDVRMKKVVFVCLKQWY